MPLTFIGTGVWEETDISLKGLVALEHSDVVFAEQYTSETEQGALVRLSRMANKEVRVLTREEVEDGRIILNEAKSKRVAFLVAGDPMISTTHLALKLEALRRGIPVRIIHASSILSAAISESGLHVYKFGRPVTLAFWSDDYRPMTPYEVIEDNLKRDLHTMLFLDIKEGKRMSAREALELLMEMERVAKRKVVSKGTKLVVLSKIGSEVQKISYGTIEQLAKADLGGTPHIIILPGKLHFTEEEALAPYAV